MSGNRLLDAAISYAKRGWSVLPLMPRGKTPATTNGLKDASTEIDQIEAFWEKFPDCNVGVAMGTAAGNVFAIDIDYDDESGEDGWATVREWEKEHGKLPSTASDISGRGGGRLYYIADRPVANSTNKELGIDVRGEGGYAVMPPSIHPNGNEYAWEVPPDEVPPAVADDTVYEFLDYIQGHAAQRGQFQQKPRFELPPGDIGEGCRNDTLFRYASKLQALGHDDGSILAIVAGINAAKCKPPLSDDEIEQIVESALGYEKGSSKARETSIDAAPEQVDASVVIFPHVNKDGTPKNTLSNYVELLRNDPFLSGRIAYNELDHSVYIVGGVPWAEEPTPRRFQDSDYANLRAYCERFNLHSSVVNVEDAVRIEADRNRFSPIADWLRALPEWDGVSRIDTLLHDFLGVRQTDLTSWVMHNFMWGCVARALSPGVKYDFMPIFVGKQGIGKSLFVRRLAVESMWFDDSFNVVLSETAIERLNGLWIAEIPELSAFKRTKDIEAIKAFLTTTQDSIRPKYGRVVEHRPRVCCFIGTTNKMEFLSDSTGNRRFIPINLMDADEPAYELSNEGFCREHFMMCWAEALWEWENKKSVTPNGARAVSLTMPREMADSIACAREQHEEDKPLSGIIGEWLNRLPPSRDRICAVMIAHEALDMDRANIPGWLINDIREIIMNEHREWIPCGRQRVGEYGIQRAFAKR